MRRKRVKNIINDVKQFSQDGCSYAPEFDFLDCCLMHDHAYKSGNVSRRIADKELRKCIRQRGHFFLCWVYWAGVRLLGKKAYQGRR